MGRRYVRVEFALTIRDQIREGTNWQASTFDEAVDIYLGAYPEDEGVYEDHVYPSLGYAKLYKEQLAAARRATT